MLFFADISDADSFSRYLLNFAAESTPPCFDYVSGYTLITGLFMYLPCTDEIRVVDMRTLPLDVAPQEVEPRLP